MEQWTVRNAGGELLAVRDTRRDANAVADEIEAEHNIDLLVKQEEVSVEDAALYGS